MRPVATLSRRGVLTSVTDALNEEMLNFYLCHHDQTESFEVTAPPVSRLLQLYGDQPLEFARAIKDSLNIWLRYTFDTVEIDVESSSEDDPVTKIQIGVIVVEQGKRYQLNHQLLSEGTRMIEVLNSNGDKLVEITR